MASKDRSRVKGRKESGSFTALPHAIFRSTAERPAPVAALSKMALALLVDLSQQFTGSNNGDLCAAPKILAPYGWRSRGTVDDALVELVALGFLVMTRQGGRNRASLFAVTWRGIDPGPHEARPDPVPCHLWKSELAHLRDPGFVRRWEKCQKRRRGGFASRYADKPSRYPDKSASSEAA